ncbi:hypothetical protein LCGC14_0629950 [marine sediment metagenome]|uniref:Uncharacterized protein n=1 Tax=marine sediment metagenome TaxID=412755 RepID=A0A0F9UAR1_9ZZZZ
MTDKECRKLYTCDCGTTIGLIDDHTRKRCGPCVIVERDQLSLHLQTMIDHCSCASGGFEGGEVVAQPCKICDLARKLVKPTPRHI